MGLQQTIKLFSNRIQGPFKAILFKKNYLDERFEEEVDDWINYGSRIKKIYASPENVRNQILGTFNQMKTDIDDALPEKSYVIRIRDKVVNTQFDMRFEWERSLRDKTIFERVKRYVEREMAAFVWETHPKMEEISQLNKNYEEISDKYFSSKEIFYGLEKELNNLLEEMKEGEADVEGKLKSLSSRLDTLIEHGIIETKGMYLREKTTFHI